MSMFRAIAAVTVLLSATPSTSQQLSFETPAPPSVDSAVFEGVPTEGVLTHRMSGVRFAARIGGFQRWRGIAALPDGSDVAVNYTAVNGAARTDATVILFKPTGAHTEQTLQGSMLACSQRSPQAFVWAEGPFAIAGPVPLTAYKGTYKTGIGKDSILDSLYFVELGEWTVKVRVTYTQFQPHGEDEADALVRAIEWPALLKAGNGCTGPACRPPAATTFRLHFLEFMSGDPRPFDRAAEKSWARAGKFETSIGRLDVHAGPSGEAMWVKAPRLGVIRLRAAPDKIAAFAGRSIGRLTLGSAIYAVEYEEKRIARYGRFFDGRPSPAQFAEAAAELAARPDPRAIVNVRYAAQHQSR